MIYEKPITFDKFVRWLSCGLLVLAVIALINYLGSVLLPFAAAWLFAYLLYPMVKFVQYKLHVPGRVLSIVVTLVIVVAILTGIAWLIIPPIIEQFQRLGELFTTYIQTTAKIDSIPEAIGQWTQEHRRELDDFVRSDKFTESVKDALPKMYNMVGETASILISIVASLITLLYMFFILMDYEYLTENWIKIFPKKVRPFWSELAKDAERELSNYIRGQGTIAFIMGVLFCIGFTIIDFPMAIGLVILIGPAGTAQGSRYGTELLDCLCNGCCRICHRTTDYRPRSDALCHGQGHAPESCHPATVVVGMGSIARLHRTNHRSASHYPTHGLLSALHHQGERGI